ncbi:hypothetical protein [Streptomyces sp. XD-27]|uniref:hypothetical protein n=1 Tax=Streptomyces sp. XD-27 TaxID=3062779 RepID=UPI0026F4420D|nr:hypothetical protein [Streptomyces sp. XD-27]WKX71409.1 hypothetical protein Q3Y56_17180 [Streptomyces sp. XD-27]
MRVRTAVIASTALPILLSGCSADGGGTGRKKESLHQVTYEAAGSQVFDVNYDTGAEDADGMAKDRAVKGLKGKWSTTVEATADELLALTVNGVGEAAPAHAVGCAVSVDGILMEKHATKPEESAVVQCVADVPKALEKAAERAGGTAGGKPGERPDGQRPTFLPPFLAPMSPDIRKAA